MTLEPSLEITRHNIITPLGNTIHVFYNPAKNLLVIDLRHKNDNGGNELLRKVLNEPILLSHVLDYQEEVEEEKDVDNNY